MSALPQPHALRDPDETVRRLYLRYADPVYRFCLRRLGSREEAEDATQTTFLNALGGLRRGSIPRVEAAWLFGIAENTCHRIAGAQRAIPAQEVVDQARALERSEVDLPGLERAFRALPESQRRAILLREVRGLSYREVAEELGLGESAVEALIFRARRSLAKALEHERPRRVRALDLAGLLGWLKGLGGGAAAVKATAAAVAVCGAAVALVETGALGGGGESRPDAPPVARTVPAADVARGSTAGASVEVRPAVPDARRAAEPAKRAPGGPAGSAAPAPAQPVPPSAPPSSASSPPAAGELRVVKAAPPASTVSVPEPPALSLPGAGLPSVDLPAVTVPELSTPALEVPGIEVGGVETPAVTVPPVTVQLPPVDPPEVPAEPVAETVTGLLPGLGQSTP